MTTKIQLRNDGVKNRSTVRSTGSGFGPFVEGEPIVSLSQLKAGDLLTEYSTQFDARNIVRVTSVEAEAFHGQFVNPNDPSKSRIFSTGVICYWEWEFNSPKTGTAKTVLHRAVDAAKGYEQREMRKPAAFKFRHTTLSSYPDQIVGVTLLDEKPGFTGIYVRDKDGGLWPARTVDRSLPEHHQSVCDAWMARAGNNEDKRTESCERTCQG